MSRTENDLLDTIVERLYRLRQACGSRVFRDAVDRALVAIGRSALEEAERRAAVDAQGLGDDPALSNRAPPARVRRRVRPGLNRGRWKCSPLCSPPSSPPTPCRGADFEENGGEKVAMAEGPSLRDLEADYGGCPIRSEVFPG